MLTRSTLHQKILCVIPAIAAFGILPLTIYRFMQEEWLIAALDTLIFILMSVIGYQAYHHKHVNLLKALFSLVVTIGALLTIYLKGSQQLFWCYPAIATVFYLLEVRWALVISTIALVCYALIVHPLLTPIEYSGFIITLIITGACSYAFSYETQKQYNELIELTKTDPLTKCLNRRAFNEICQQYIDNYQRHPEPLSMILIDIDKFKRINDTYGHVQGDRVLKAICDAIRQRLRKNDYLFRVGGEEFVILPHHINLTQSLTLAETLREEISKLPLINNNPITISCGVSEYLDANESFKDWYARTDDALYLAKDKRNSICCSNQAESSANQSLATK